MAKVVLAMSGGVDSSVAAHLLQQAGHEVIGVFMRHGIRVEPACPAGGLAKRGKQGCCSAEDAADARRVADQLDIPFYAIDLAEDFGRIVDYFCDEYLRGRTPNPCIVCNHWLKFGRLFDYAASVGAQYVATGHHARLVDGADGRRLLRGADAEKDQSYVLFGVPRERLERMLLPVGERRKEQIRRLAGALGLPVAGKPDSQEICFAPPGRHAELLRQLRPGEAGREGELVTTDGRVVGRHGGVERFTIGQRKGLGVALGEPYFVVRIDPETRRVVVGRREELARRELTASRVNWLAPVPQAAFHCSVQIRYNSPPATALVEPLGPDRLRVRFDQPCYGVAPGQAAVCYDGPRVLGGGWIDTTAA